MKTGKKKNHSKIYEELLKEVLEERAKEESNQPKIKHYIIRHDEDKKK